MHVVGQNSSMEFTPLWSVGKLLLLHENGYFFMVTFWL